MLGGGAERQARRDSEEGTGAAQPGRRGETEADRATEEHAEPHTFTDQEPGGGEALDQAGDGEVALVKREEIDEARGADRVTPDQKGRGCGQGAGRQVGVRQERDETER